MAVYGFLRIPESRAVSTHRRACQCPSADTPPARQGLLHSGGGGGRGAHSLSALVWVSPADSQPGLTVSTVWGVFVVVVFFKLAF